MSWLKKVQHKTLSRPVKAKKCEQVLLLVDWENLFVSLFSVFKNEMRLEYRLSEMLSWIQGNVGELWGGHGFVFAPEHLNVIHQEICTKLGFKFIICPKRQLTKPKKNPKSGLMVSEEDTVDETIIWFGMLIAKHPDVKHICLVSSDSDYIPFLREVSCFGVEIALVFPSIISLGRSKGKQLIKLADRSKNGCNKLILKLDEL